MNRRSLLKAALAMPVVAALAPLLPKSVSRVITTPDIDLLPVSRVPRYLRYRISWPVGLAQFNPRVMVRLESFSEYSEPMANPYAERGDEGPVTVYPLPPPSVGDDYEIVVEQSEDARTWRPADPTRVKVVPLR